MKKYLFAIIPLLFIMPMASYGEQCEPLDLLCRQTQATTPEPEPEKAVKIITVDSDRYATFEKQAEELYNLEKFLERQTIPISEYLKLITCTQSSCDMGNFR